jgi:hypothetical protein
MFYVINIVGFVLKTFSNDANFEPTTNIFLSNHFSRKMQKIRASYLLEWREYALYFEARVV